MPVAHPVARDRLPQHDAPSAASDMGAAIFKAVERALQPLHVTALVDQPPVPDLADLIDAIGKLIAAVLDMDRGFAIRPIAAVDIGDAQHET